MTTVQISILLSIGSLALGAASWIFGILAITASRPERAHGNTVASFCFCAVSLFFQLYEIGNRAGIGDYAAIEDTIRAVLLASWVLITVTAGLNFAALVKAKGKN